MIDPTTGFAPPPWQSAVGSVAVFRPSGAAISVKEVVCMHSFLDALLDEFSEVSPGALLHKMTAAHFDR